MSTYPRFFRYIGSSKLVRFDRPENGFHLTDWEGQRDEAQTSLSLVYFTETTADLWEEVSESVVNGILKGGGK